MKKCDLKIGDVLKLKTKNELLKSGFKSFFSKELGLDIITNFKSYGIIYGVELECMGKEVSITYLDEDGIEFFVNDNYNGFLSYECFAVDWED